MTTATATALAEVAKISVNDATCQDRVNDKHKHKGGEDTDRTPITGTTAEQEQQQQQQPASSGSRSSRSQKENTGGGGGINNNNHNDNPKKGQNAVRVVYVSRLDAKRVKMALEKAGMLHKDFRMTPAIATTSTDSTEDPTLQQSTLTKEEIENNDNDAVLKNAIALPLPEDLSQVDIEGVIEKTPNGMAVLLGYGRQFCPYSSALLGNHGRSTTTPSTTNTAARGRPTPRRKFPTNTTTASSDSGGDDDDPDETDTYIGASNLSLPQQALYQSCLFFLSSSTTLTATNGDDDSPMDHKNNAHAHERDIIKCIRSLPLVLCPRNLEQLGDDKTLVIPQYALGGFDEYNAVHGGSDNHNNSNDDNSKNQSTSTNTRSVDLLAQFISLSQCPSPDDFWKEVWRQLASLSKSPRIVRRGRVDPESRTRESGYQLLWPYSAAVPDEFLGPQSPGWITCTEQGIRQSFDLTRVMFSRGNVTEKIRFGRLVQKDEIVLDLYAGIGYFTLPALLHGQAQHVYCCEWNHHAVLALKYNLEQNRIPSTRATVLQGDCRVVCRQHGLVRLVDRVSLGLLPSSQGGWKTAVRALNPIRGGWLHVHGNVPVHEVDSWNVWLCSCLLEFVKQEKDAWIQQQQQTQQQQQPTSSSSSQSPVQSITSFTYDQWSVVGTHIERVKSFAPTVNHYVADVFVGPVDRLSPLPPLQNKHAADNNHSDTTTTGLLPGMAAVIRRHGENRGKNGRRGNRDNHHTPDDRAFLEICPPFQNLPPPSCALSPDGVLHQAWMRDVDNDHDDNAATK